MRPSGRLPESCRVDAVEEIVSQLGGQFLGRLDDFVSELVRHVERVETQPGGRYAKLHFLVVQVSECIPVFGEACLV